jgi:cytochrome c biogenesis protein CcmG, thiol:disulfide interchange protein DsbE
VRRLIALAFCLVGACIAVAGCGSAGLGEGQAPPPTVAVKDRRPAPSFSLPALDGDGRVTLAAHRGRPVVVNFWASWCEPCKRETPALVAFSKAHPEVDVVGLATTDRPADSRAFAKRYGVPYPLGVDRSGDVGNRYGIAGLPTTIIVDQQGRVFVSWSGPITQDDLERFAKELGA